MNDQEFLSMCRLAAAPDTGGQWTDEKIDAIEAVEADPRGVVTRLYAILTTNTAERSLHDMSALTIEQLHDIRHAVDAQLLERYRQLRQPTP